jgi:hypothetical protein
MGQGSAALMGWASGDEAIAIGPGSLATGKSSVSIGNAAEASGISSYAWGTFTRASGDHSMAIGQNADTNGKSGSFVWGDGTQGFSSVKAVTNNQFVVRATRFWFGNNNSVTSSIGKFIETSSSRALRGEQHTVTCWAPRRSPSIGFDELVSGRSAVARPDIVAPLARTRHLWGSCGSGG